MSKDFSHLDRNNQAAMVDVGHKIPSSRVAVAEALVQLDEHIVSKFEEGDILTKKGSVFGIAKIAGIMGAKKTADLIPLCHPLALDNCKLSFELANENCVRIVCEAKTTGKTGVEMEALTGASVAALTIYDMCKAMSHDIEIKAIKLLSKQGGKSDYKRV